MWKSFPSQLDLAPPGLQGPPVSHLVSHLVSVISTVVPGVPTPSGQGGVGQEPWHLRVEDRAAAQHPPCTGSSLLPPWKFPERPQGRAETPGLATFPVVGRGFRTAFGEQKPRRALRPKIFIRNPP